MNELDTYKPPKISVFSGWSTWSLSGSQTIKVIHPMSCLKSVSQSESMIQVYGTVTGTQLNFLNHNKVYKYKTQVTWNITIIYIASFSFFSFSLSFCHILSLSQCLSLFLSLSLSLSFFSKCFILLDSSIFLIPKSYFKTRY